jgi:hypothetical protein
MPAPRVAPAQHNGGDLQCSRFRLAGRGNYSGALFMISARCGPNKMGGGNFRRPMLIKPDRYQNG